MLHEIFLALGMIIYGSGKIEPADNGCEKIMYASIPPC